MELTVISLEDSCVALFSVIKAWNTVFFGPIFFAQGRMETCVSTQPDRALLLSRV